MSQITTHVLDSAIGSPAAGLSVTLKRYQGDQWEALAQGVTNDDGRVPNFVSQAEPLPAGTYRVRFETEPYLLGKNMPVFYPWVDVVFNLDDSGEHYHIPLLLSAFGYSTYRGS